MISGSNESDFEVWFAIDQYTTDCGLVAAWSLLESRKKDFFTNIRIAYPAGQPPPASGWEIKLKLSGKKFSFKQVPIDLSEFSHCKKIFGSLAAYLRICIPHYTTRKKCIYLDADLIVREDIGGLVDEISQCPLYCVPVRKLLNISEKERNVINKYRKNKSLMYFNSGVVAFNCETFKNHQVFNLACKIAKDDSESLVVYDQTIINCLDSEQLDSKWNQIIGAHNQKTGLKKGGILHFVGSPKPWDLFGKLFCPQARIWFETAKKPQLKYFFLVRYLQPKNWLRAWRIRKQYKLWNILL